MLHGPTRLEVFHLAGTTLGNPEAGRLTTVRNGYGAVTTIKYRSAKEDASTSHQVPFPEVVVTSVETTGTLGLGGSSAVVGYAYGDAEMIFDPVLDGFTMSGYGRSVEVRGLGEREGEADLAIIKETNKLAAFTASFATDASRFDRYQQAGRLRDVSVLTRSVPRDPWVMLSSFLGPLDSRHSAGQHMAWSTRYLHASSAQDCGLDCIDVMYPYDWDLSVATNIGFAPAFSRGFSYAASVEGWTGTQLPPSTSNVQTRTEVLAVDDHGNVLSIKNENDRFRADDDLCVELTYAQAATTTRMLSSPATRKVTDCSPENQHTLLFDTWEYDGLAVGAVSLGRPTAHTFDRRRTDTGQLLGTIREYEAMFDAVGNPIYVASAREDGTLRTIELEYDEFGLTSTSTTVAGSAVDPITTSVEHDPVTLDELSARDASRTTWSKILDGFGRVTQTAVEPVEGVFGILSTTEYLGFSGSDPAGRRIRTLTYRDPTPEALLGEAPRREAIAHLDELGRIRRAEQMLGADYAGEILITSSPTYDPLGRVSFEPDPYPAGQSAATVYGTSYHYSTDGTLKCAIRGNGPQELTEITDPVAERFPTCLTRTFVNNQLRLAVSAPDALLAGSPQAGVTRVETLSAIGRTLSRETLQGSTRLELAHQSYDRLGNLVNLIRYQDPANALAPVSWSWNLDSRGQTLSFAEPETATRTFTYSDWGELLATEWTDATTIPATDVAIVQGFDAFGRLAWRGEVRNDMKEVGFDWSYEETGRLASSHSELGDVQLKYDAYGNVSSRTFIDHDSAQQYVESTTHHVDGTIGQLDFELPDTAKGESYKYEYDSAGRLRLVENDGIPLYRAAHIDPWGRVEHAVFGPDLNYHAENAQTGRRLPVQEELLLASGGSRRIEHTSYDAIGRELSRREFHDGFLQEVTSSAYDPLGRLGASTEMIGATPQYNTTFSYDALGNAHTLQNTVGGAHAYLTFSGVDRDRVCRVSYGAPTSGPCNVTHDGAGNVVSQPTRSGGVRQLAYFPGGAVQTITEGSISASFRYGASDDISETQITGSSLGGAALDRRFGLIQRREVNVNGVIDTILVRSIPGDGGIIATKRGADGPWIFPFAEERGTRLTSDGSSFVQTTSYLPFGEARTQGPAPSSPTFTSDQWNSGNLLADLGLVHLGARVYDPVIGRFLSRDPLIVPRTAATTNPYAFAANDPINRSDPTGLDFGFLCGPETFCSADFGSVGSLLASALGRAAGANGAAESAAAPSPLPKAGGVAAHAGGAGGMWPHWKSAPWHRQIKLGTRVVGGLKFVSGFAAAKIGAALCATGLGCGVGSVLVVLGVDYMGAGGTEIWSGENAPTAVGAVLGEEAQAIQEAIIGGGSLAGAFRLMTASKLIASAASGTCPGGICVCFVAGTPVDTSERSKPIETVMLADRVGPESSECEKVTFDGWAELHLTISVANDDPGHHIFIELLRPVEWLSLNKVEVGGVIALRAEEIGMEGPALVTAVLPGPTLKPGVRCPVTGRVRHRSAEVLELRLASGEKLGVTAGHPLYSEDRGGWVPAGELRNNEKLRTQDGVVLVESLATGFGAEVFNLEVYEKHHYYVGSDRVAAHNTTACALRGTAGQENIAAFSSLNDARAAARIASGLGDDAVDFVQKIGPLNLGGHPKPASRGHLKTGQS